MRIFLIIALILIGAAYLGYIGVGHMLYSHNYDKCIGQAKANTLFRGDVNKLCECSIGFIKDDPFFDGSDPVFAKEMGLRRISCAKTHVQEYGTDVCDTMKENLKNRTGQNLDCACMNQKILNVAMKQWEESGEVNKENLTTPMALNMVSGCLK